MLEEKTALQFKISTYKLFNFKYAFLCFPLQNPLNTNHHPISKREHKIIQWKTFYTIKLLHLTTTF